MKKNKHFKIDGQFCVHFSRIVAAKTETEAIRKARDFVVKNMKIKNSQLDRNTIVVLEID